MKIEAIFESWLIPDGNYPPFSVGDLVNLAFYLQPHNLNKCDKSEPLHFTSMGNGEYSLCGDVIWQNVEKNDYPIQVVDTEGFSFYVESEDITRFSVGDRIKSHGTLLFDYYIWAEFIHTYKNPPDIFHNFRVEKIIKISVPEKFINRHSKGKSLPTYVSFDEVGDQSIEILETMHGQPFDEEFYLIHLNDQDVNDSEIRRTFIQSEG